MRIQLQNFPYNGFDNDRGIDLTVIGTIELSFQDGYPGGIDFLHYLRVFHYLCVFRSADLRVPLTRGVRLAWDLLKVLPRHILEDHTVFGEYAITGQRYAHAALQFLRYLSSPFRETSSLDSLRQLAVDPVRWSAF